MSKSETILKIESVTERDGLTNSNFGFRIWFEIRASDLEFGLAQ